MGLGAYIREKIVACNINYSFVYIAEYIVVEMSAINLHETIRKTSR